MDSRKVGVVVVLMMFVVIGAALSDGNGNPGRQHVGADSAAVVIASGGSVPASATAAYAEHRINHQLEQQ